MNRITYGGILIWPEHPQADMHGFLRGICRTKGLNFVREQCIRAGATMASGTWKETRSAKEDAIGCLNYGRLMVCSLMQAYMDVEAYKPAEPIQKTEPVFPGGVIRDPRKLRA